MRNNPRIAKIRNNPRVAGIFGTILGIIGNIYLVANPIGVNTPIQDMFIIGVSSWIFLMILTTIFGQKIIDIFTIDPNNMNAGDLVKIAVILVGAIAIGMAELSILQTFGLQ